MRNMALGLLVTAMSVCLCSCGGTTAPPDTHDEVRAISPVAAGKTAGGPRYEGEAPPADARYTIFCDVVRGPNHVLEATQLKEDLKRTTGLSAWHILHADEQSTLFYGYYRSFVDDKSDPAEFARSQDDLRAIEKLTNAQKERMFPRALFLPINAPDPDAPPQWNLANAPAGSYWSLQVAAYYDFPERKQMAIDQVRLMREKGIEAYYYHGETISSICVGAYPRSAIKEQDADEVHTSSPEDRPLIVAGTLPPNVNGTMRDKEGHRLVVESQRLEVRSPKLAQAIRDFPQHVINGEAHAIRDKNGNPVYDPSFIVLVPHADERGARDSDDAANAGADRGSTEATRAILGDAPPKEFSSDGAPAKSRYGHLNSVDGK